MKYHSWYLSRLREDLFQSVNQSARSLAYGSAAGLGYFSQQLLVFCYPSLQVILKKNVVNFKWGENGCAGRRRSFLLLTPMMAHSQNLSVPCAIPAVNPKDGVFSRHLQFFHIKQAVKMLDGKD